MPLDLVVIGGGIAGLACARAAGEAGLRAVVLDRGGHAGGRCATRTFEGRPVDYGPTFLHGAQPAFWDELARVDATPIEGWPSRVKGDGPPCQPDAFAAGERRLAFVEGVNAFPAWLARGVDVRPRTEVAALEAGASRLRARLPDGRAETAPTVVLALPLERTRALLAPLAPASEEVRAALGLLGMVSTLPSLTVVAGYGQDVPPPRFDVCYPGDSTILQVLANDSSKRRPPVSTVMVYQAHPRWSRARLDAPGDAWRDEVLAEAGRLLGAWAARPAWTHAQRWRHARVDRGTELARPMLLTLPGGARIGLAGEVFAPGGGAEAAWRAGRMLGSSTTSSSATATTSATATARTGCACASPAWRTCPRASAPSRSSPSGTTATPRSTSRSSTATCSAGPTCRRACTPSA